MANVRPNSVVRAVLSKGLLYRIARCTLTRQDLFATSWSTELLNGYFQDRHFWKAYDPTWITVFFVFINSFSKLIFWQGSLAQILTVLPQADAKGCWLIWCTSFGLCLRQDSHVQRFVSHLNVLGSYRFLFTHWFWCADLRKKLPSSDTSTYSFLLRLRSCGVVYVYISQHIVIHNQSRFLGII